MMREQREDGYYFCHICNHRRLDQEIVQSSSGEIRCMVCDNEGFVEKITEPQSRAQPSGFRTFQQTTNAEGFPVVSATSFQFNGDPFSSVLGMPLGNFIQRVFNGMMTPMGQMGAMGTAGGVRFHTTEAQGAEFLQGIPFQSLGENARTVFQSFMQNPLDPQNMNQFVYYVMENDPNREGGTPPASKTVLESLQTEVLDEEQAKKLETCAICTEDFAAGDRVHWLSQDRKACGHAFHVDCIVPWLKQHNTCPVCRYELPTDDPEYNRQRELLRSRIVEEVQRHVSPSNSSSFDSQQQDNTRDQRSRSFSGNGVQSSYCNVQ